MVIVKLPNQVIRAASHTSSTAARFFQMHLRIESEDESREHSDHEVQYVSLSVNNIACTKNDMSCVV